MLRSDPRRVPSSAAPSAPIVLGLRQNLAQFTLTTSVAILIFREVSALGQPFGFAGWGAAIAASVTASLIGIASYPDHDAQCWTPVTS